VLFISSGLGFILYDSIVIISSRKRLPVIQDGGLVIQSEAKDLQIVLPKK
jgi:hypothetical protein